VHCFLKPSFPTAVLSLFLVSATAPLLARAAKPPAALQVAGRTELPGYSGDFDHFGVDLKGNRLFLAAEDHGTLEVFDLQSGAHKKTVKGVETPHSIVYMPDLNRLLVTDSGPGMTKVLDATTFKVQGSIKLVPGADSVGYDVPRNRLYVVTGGKDVDMKTSVLAEIDPRTGQHHGDVSFDANHVEAMAVEQHGSRLYINVTDQNYVAVVDKDKHAIIARWPIKEAEQNAPVAFDEANHRLFVVTRKPGMLVVLNAMTGESIASFKAPERCDEVVYDAANHRIYVAGGEGYGHGVGERWIQCHGEDRRWSRNDGVGHGELLQQRAETDRAKQRGRRSITALREIGGERLQDAGGAISSF